jgi:hypothetical protein
MVAAKNGPVALERLAPAQVELLWQRLLEWHDRLPEWLFVLAYDNLKGVWIDEGPPAEAGVPFGRKKPEPPLFLGQGWRPADMEGGVRFRSTWGRKSWLTILLKTPGEFRVRVRARSEVPGETVGAGLEVNGTSVGEALASPSWSDLEFRVPSATLRSGLNRLLLTADKTARARDPAHRAKNTALSVQVLRFERLPATDAGAVVTPPIDAPGEGSEEAGDGSGS